MSYYIKYPKDNNNVVECWSLKRLPFEPKGWLYDLRESLRTAVGQLTVDDDSILNATYSSPINELCDVENVLFYNIGTGAFRSACQNGFLLERSFAKVLPPTERLEDYPHYQKYEFKTKNQHPVNWAIKNTLAEWDNIVFDKLVASAKPHVFWRRFKENQVLVFVDGVYDGYYGIELELTLPKGNVVNSAAVVKPLLDGIISAFHAYEGDQLTEVTERLGAVFTDATPDYISKLIIDKKLSVLGSRCVLDPYQNFVQWNPADDKCVVIKLVCKYVEIGALPMVSGRLFAVE